MPGSIRENNFTEKGTTIQFHKTTSPIPTHDTDIRKMHDNGKYRHNRSNMIKLNNIRSMKLLHHHSTGHKSKIKVQDYNTVSEELLPKVTLQQILIG